LFRGYIETTPQIYKVVCNYTNKKVIIFMPSTNNSVSERFDALVKALGHNISSFARALGYERSDKLYNIQKGKYYPSFEILDDITKNFVSVNADWLITGRGDMFLTSNQNMESGDVEKKSIEEHLLELIKEKDAKIEEQAKQIGRLEAENEILKAENNILKKDARSTDAGDATSVAAVG
jgi:hypothetical protein